MSERRTKFLVNRPLQIRYMIYISALVLAVTTVVIASLYFGIWGGVLESFSNERVRNELLIASRITEYERAREDDQEEGLSTIALFKQAENLNQRQRKIFREILNRNNRRLIPKFFLLLILIAWGSIYLSHKIAGPLQQFHTSLERLDRGDLRTRIHLRKSDEAQSLALRFNHTIENFDFVFSKIKNIIRENESNPERMKTRLKEELSKYHTSADR